MALLDHSTEELVTFHAREANAPSGNILVQMGKLRPQSGGQAAELTKNEH